MNNLTEEQVRQIFREELFSFLKSDRFTFEKKIQILNGRNIIVGKGTGTKIGTETTQKIGFFNATPVVQQGAIGAPTSPGATYVQAEAQSAVTTINSIRSALTALGLTA